MRLKKQTIALAIVTAIGLTACHKPMSLTSVQDPVDCINPYMGNISHLLVPTYPTVHLPNSMMRVYPERADYTAQIIHGLPTIVTSHRGTSAFRISPISGLNDSLPEVKDYTYDNEYVKPYRYKVDLDEENISVDYAPSFQSAIYEFSFENNEKNPAVVLNTANGQLKVHDNTFYGYQTLQDSTKVYIYMESSEDPEGVGVRDSLTGKLLTGDVTSIDSAYVNHGVLTGKTVLAWYKSKTKAVKMRYGVSFISVEQARKNLRREIASYEVNVVAKRGKNEWIKAFNSIKVQGGTEDQRAVFYTSLYRTFERMICISEDGHYYSASDGKVHNDEGIPFYTDDWAWDTYRAAHPLRMLIDPQKEAYMISSYIRMAKQSPDGWLPTFPEVTGDSHRMNGNHAIAIIADAYAKGINGFNLNEGYEAAKKVMSEKTFIPWMKFPKVEIDKFMDDKGYYPALHPGERETEPKVSKWERRQSVAVTLGASYDYWCLSQLANFTGKAEESKEFLAKSYNYRNLFNYETGFFHPKDNQGKFITPFDYKLSGGQGARDYYDENNGYTYRWDVQHNPADLIYLMGGKEQFIKNLDATFRTPIDGNRFEFYYQMPDQTGNVGQFSMANEPSLHIPYLYNYAGQPWRTQKLIRKLVGEWFRNDLMGVPGDEDGGGMSAFVVFSMMGIYPVTPGMPVYNIGSPFFPEVTITQPGGRKFVITADNVSEVNKYIQSAELNGKKLNKPWLKHSDIVGGGSLVLKMGPKPNKNWGIEVPPPSADPYQPYISKKKK
ncbi:GH92 family glycosyl hydrolase [Porphyromonas pogonae]|uniref:GH92 family glycosyl hydrolase n=1 Tax=Porphyromonas pogonae TaxID=867595 RepID=UPI002E77DCD6|nr:GH92 family glycosyl hydrolase [Porphyromonas pogonae]